ncbi:MAG TPA: hypothetical protein VEX60_14515 [Pyrinomonadaceae bacterium]|nr:hypothetical protein [Pyrinomonadaceae bacterium]
MKRSLLVSLCLLLLGTSAFSQSNQKLASVTKIYLGELGKGEGADLVREKIRLRLMKSKRFIVVETEEDADAILTGAVGISSNQVSSVSTNPATGQVTGGGATVYEGSGVVRLIDPKTKETIWIYEYKRGFFRPRSASGDVAGKIVSSLLKDTKKVEEKSKEDNPKKS